MCRWPEFLVGNALLIRTRETPAPFTNALGAKCIRSIRPWAPYAAIVCKRKVDGRGYTQRLAATLLRFSAGMALFLAAIDFTASCRISFAKHA